MFNYVNPAQSVACDMVKDWNFMVYMCNNNNLYRYGMQSFRQMIGVGSTPLANLLIQMDELDESAVSRFYIEKNNPLCMDRQIETLTSFSGTPENLFEFAQWGVSRYQSKYTCLVLWNHASGIKDPKIWGRVMMRLRDAFFALNAQTGLLELNRSLSEASGYRSLHRKRRGIAFNESAEAYINNQDLKNSLEKISHKLLDGKKIDVVCFDACYMGMIEVAAQIKKAVHFMVASEELEPGAGYRYDDPLLLWLGKKKFTPPEFAQHIVCSYQQSYQTVFADYTQSAVDLTYVDAMEQNITQCATALINILEQGGYVAARMLYQLRCNQSAMTEFFDTDYVDLGHMLESLMIKSFQYVHDDEIWNNDFGDEYEPLREMWRNVYTSACQAHKVLQKMVIQNAVGINVARAQGLAIYFPLGAVHQSYYKTEFAQATTWAQFLDAFIRAKKILHRSTHRQYAINDYQHASLKNVRLAHIKQHIYSQVPLLNKQTLYRSDSQ